MKKFSNNPHVQKIATELTKAGCNVIVTPREAMGWPCFYCGKTLASCKVKKCCNKCDKPDYHSH